MMNMDKETLRKVVFAQLNAKTYEVELLKNLLAEIDGGTVEAQEAQPEAAPVKKAEKKTESKPKAKAKPEPVQEEVEAEETEEADDMFGDDAAEEDQGPTLEDVRKVVKDFATKHGKEKALKLLGKFKVTAIPDIKKSDYAKVIELAKKHL